MPLVEGSDSSRSRAASGRRAYRWRYAWPIAAIVVASWAWRHDRLVVPDEWNPWKPLRIDAPATWVTRYKLRRLADDPPACFAALNTSAIRYERLPDRGTGDDCGFKDALTIRSTGLAFNAPFALTCPTAAALLLWQTHAVQPAALEHLHAPVARIEHFGSYACRNVYGRERGPRSAHATANALDIAGFVLADGRRVRVARDWRGDAASAAFLRAARDGACRWFDGVLSPDYNAAHHDHVHVERGHARACR